MSGKICRIKIEDILNYYENPRHAVAVNEKDTLKKLFAAVGNQYICLTWQRISKNMARLEISR